ncbi:MAG: hypothetical protein KDE47_06460 [Caldilineaceae bacterium]|nr:hypothetical protein [Caldilineaceae bacterium]
MNRFPFLHHPTLLFPLLIGGLLLTFAGYIGAWVPHRVSGLVITGLDLGEYVKFLPLVRSGQIVLWRAGFYLPLVAVSLAAGFAAFQPTRQLRPWLLWVTRALLLILATVAALNLLPPAWDQSTFTNPEFRQQIVALVICLGVMATSPLWALLPQRMTAGVVIALCAGALWFPLWGFFRVLPSIRELYQQPLVPGWGLYLTVAGLVLLIVVHGICLLRNRNARN